MNSRKPKYTFSKPQVWWIIIFWTSYIIGLTFTFGPPIFLKTAVIDCPEESHIRCLNPYRNNSESPVQKEFLDPGESYKIGYQGPSLATNVANIGVWISLAVYFIWNHYQNNRKKINKIPKA